MNSIVIKDLCKNFGEKEVLKGLSMTVKEGSIFGFIGKNGAGKTTTLKILLGLIKADGGEAYVCGERVKFGQNATNQKIGYVEDVPSFYNYMKPMEYLRLCGEVAGLPSDIIQARSLSLLERVGLANAERKIGGFSRGMKQRLGIAQALMCEPSILICDEPTSALDPTGRKEILDLLKEIKDKTTIIFSTHILSDIERICDYLAVLSDGKIVMSGSFLELKSRYRQEVLEVELSSIKKAQEFCGLLASNQVVGSIVDNKVTIVTDDVLTTQAQVLNILIQNKLLVIKIEVVEPTLEDLYLEVVT